MTRGQLIQLVNDLEDARLRLAEAARPFAHCLKPRCKFCGGNSHHWNSEPIDQKLCMCEIDHPSRVNTITTEKWFSVPCNCCDGCTLVAALGHEGIA